MSVKQVAQLPMNPREIVQRNASCTVKREA
jgi:hypothetical protein